jgi:diguanylate cyclase (GGDEF)-like protein
MVIMMIYFPLFFHRPWFGLESGFLVLLLEYFPVIILTPLTQVIHDLQLAGYVEIFNLYYIYPLFLGVLVLITRILNASSKIKKERERLQHFQKALKGILSGLKLVRSTEEFGVILQKTTKLLAELLGYKEALISVINQETKNIERIGYYGMKKQAFEELQKEAVSADTVNAVFDNQYEFAGTYFVPSESGLFKSIWPEKSINMTGEEKVSGLWKEDDLFLVPLVNSESRIIGYISLDFPIDGKRPSEEDAEIARIFAEQIGRMLETSMKYKEIVETTQIDRMTKLCNHTYFYERADELVKRSDFEKPLAFLVLDIDDFKKFNDKYGHLTGDNVLINVARIMRKNVPENSVVARYGGEEFAILLPGTPKLKAVEVANNLVREIRNTKIDGLSVTISCGVSTFPEDGRYSSTLVSAADSALYISKKTGKDKVTMV